MNLDNQPTPEEINWITLKEAALMLGCSVKTIRRRIKGGTWRSMIEYQGQKAIRLVAREDVLKETSALDRIPADSPEAALALQALDGLPLQLGEVLKNYLSQLKKDFDRSARVWRIYLLLAVGAASLLSGAIGYFLSERREKTLEGRIGEVSRTLSTTFSRAQSGLERELALISDLAAESRRLADESAVRSDRQGRDLKTLLESVGNLEEADRASRGEAAAARKEIEALRREIDRLEKGLGEKFGEEKPPEIPPAKEEPDLEDDPSTSTDREGENPRSRFLGIF